MGIYGNNIVSDNNNLLEEFSNHISNYKSYGFVVSEMIDLLSGEFENYNQLIGESVEVIQEAGKFSIKTIWEGIKKFVKKIWEWIKDIPNKFKILFSKFKSKKVEDDFEEFFDDFEEEFPDADLKVEPNKTEEQYQAEIDKLKTEIEILQQKNDYLYDRNDQLNRTIRSNMANANKALKDQEEKSDKQNKLNMKRNELRVLKIQKAIKHILDNDILYWSPYILLNNYQIDLSNYKRYVIEEIDSLEKLEDFANNDDDKNVEKSTRHFLTTLVRPEVLSLDPDSGFRFGGFDHYKLHDYAKQQMAEKKKKNPILDPKQIIDKRIIFDQTPELERLLINLRDIIGLLNSKIAKCTPLDPNDSSIMRKKDVYVKYDYDDGAKDVIPISEREMNVIKNIKEYIRALEAGCQVVSVAANFQGRYMGALQSSATVLKALL